MTELEKAKAYYRELEKDVDRLVNTYIIVGTVILVAFTAWCTWRSYRQPIEERAAYLEGRFDLDHATAIAFAEAE